MTRLAFGAALAAVRIVDAVACDTGFSHVPVDFAGMTCRATNLDVCAVQREVRLGMIELLDRAPRFLVVTRRAVRAEAPLVRLVVLVARPAITRSIAVFAFVRMTACAINRRVRPIQRELRPGVIEQ
ncbi:MAG: hypothetical protein R3D44_13510 [Hyphomicrobiaceae bacterium]